MSDKNKKFIFIVSVYDIRTSKVIFKFKLDHFPSKEDVSEFVDTDSANYFYTVTIKKNKYESWFKTSLDVMLKIVLNKEKN